MGPRLAMVVAALVLATAMTAPAGAQGVPACAANHWVATWTADPGGALGSGFNGQTLRVILSPHVGGDQVRVHLSNRFGAKPVTFARAWVALRQSGATLVAGSGRRLTFSAQPTVTVPAGGEAISDPAPIAFGAFQDLAVSLYVAGPTGPSTGHLVARERSYLTAPSAGDHAAEDGASAFTGETTAVDYVDAVDARVSGGVGAVVLFGDSITDGFPGPAGAAGASGLDANQRYPDYLARRLLAEPGGPRLSVLNAGIAGNRLLADGRQSLTGPSALSRLDSDVLAVSGVTDAIVLEGINDLALLATPDQVTKALKQVVDRLHARGVRVLLGTLTPAGVGLVNFGNLLQAIFIGGATNGMRIAVNTWIRSGASGADGVVDFDRALRESSANNQLRLALDSGDHVHPSPGGYSTMADAVDLSSLRGGSSCEAAPAAVTKLRVRARARSGGHLRVSGSLLGAEAVGCAGTKVTVRALSARRTVLKRRLRVTAACSFARTFRIAARGRIEVRVSFAGTAALLASHSRRMYVRAR